MTIYYYNYYDYHYIILYIILYYNIIIIIKSVIRIVKGELIKFMLLYALRPSHMITRVKSVSKLI